MADTAEDDTVRAGVNPDPLWDDWGTPPRVPGIPQLHLDGFDGPMDLFLDLVRRQHIDLGQISILQLIEQFIAGMQRVEGHVAVKHRADWLVMATQLLLLRSQFLFPASRDAEAEAAQDTSREARRLDELAFVRAAAAWLDERPQLGRDVFARPQGRDPRVATYMALMEGCLFLLRGHDEQPGREEEIYRPSSVHYRVDAAIARIRTLVAERPEEDIAFFRCLPTVTADDLLRDLTARAAVASSFVAVLELTRAGEVSATQTEQQGLIVIKGRV